MVELARSDILTDQSLIHKIWRGHNREWIFSGDSEKEGYLNALNRTISKEAGHFHSICLMSNHTHEIYHISDLSLFCDFMRKHHSLFGRFYNKMNSRTGPVSEARPKTVPIKSDTQEMITTFYVHTNPIRSKLVDSLESLKKYIWSTHLLYGYGIFKPWMKSIVLPEWYIELGTTSSERQRYYLYLLNEYMQIPEQQFLESVAS